MTAHASPLVEFATGFPGAARTDGVREFLLRRTGTRPLRFTGIEICSAVGDTGEGRLWYEIRVYRVDGSRYVLAVDARKRTLRDRDTHRVWTLDSFDAVLARLEDYDPKLDVAGEPGIMDPTLSEAGLCLLGADLKLTLMEAERRYRTLLGELLYELEVDDG